jgi:hypothetical protein
VVRKLRKWHAPHTRDRQDHRHLKVSLASTLNAHSNVLDVGASAGEVGKFMPSGSLKCFRIFSSVRVTRPKRSTVCRRKSYRHGRPERRGVDKLFCHSSSYVDLALFHKSTGHK